MAQALLHRRHLLLAGSAAALGLPNARAQAAWPARPVTVVVPFPPGGGTDAFARPLFALMSKNTGRQFVIDNKGGAGGTLGAGVAARAAADGKSGVSVRVEWVYDPEDDALEELGEDLAADLNYIEIVKIELTS